MSDATATKLTAKELHVLEAFFKADFFGEGDAWPKCNGGPDGFDIYSWAVVDACDPSIVSKRGASGVFSSLTKKGLITGCHHQGEDAGVQLTWKGVNSMNVVSSVCTDYLKPTEPTIDGAVVVDRILAAAERELREKSVAVDPAIDELIEEDVDHLAWINKAFAGRFDGIITSNHPNSKTLEFGGRNLVSATVDFAGRYGEKPALHIELSWWSGKDATTQMMNALMMATDFRHATQATFSVINASS